MMNQPFIQIGKYHLNINAVAYTVSSSAGIKIVTTNRREDGKPFTIMIRGESADRVRDALGAFVAVCIDVPVDN
jgi:hypothetical protein